MTTPAGLVLVTGGSGYVAVFCIAQLLQEGWRVRTTMRSLAKAEQVRASVSKIGAEPTAIEFVKADLNSDKGWDQAVGGADYVSHVASPVPLVNSRATMTWFAQRAMARCVCSRLRAMLA